MGRVSGNETVTPLFLKSYIGAVAPFTGAWIETRDGREILAGY